MPDFNQVAPPETVTNPAAAATPKGAQYPKHLYKYGEGKNSVVVAWDGDKSIHNQIIEVDGPDAEAKQLAAGYALDPVLKAKK